MKIYYFSGTGNSLFIANGIRNIIPDTEIELINNEMQSIHINESVVGIITPLYYFGLPEIVHSFIKNISFKKNVYIFLIITRGIPLAGGAKRQIDTSEYFKNSLKYFRYLTMGDNYVLDFWDASNFKVMESRNTKALKEIKRICKDIKNKKESKRYNFVDYLWPISNNIPRFGNKVYSKHILHNDQYFVLKDTCTKCQKCLRNCPVKNIAFDKQIIWKHENCQMCLGCFHCCPTQSIEYIRKDLKINTEGKARYWNK